MARKEQLIDNFKKNLLSFADGVTITSEKETVNGFELIITCTGDIKGIRDKLAPSRCIVYEMLKHNTMKIIMLPSIFYEYDLLSNAGNDNVGKKKPRITEEREMKDTVKEAGQELSDDNYDYSKEKFKPGDRILSPHGYGTIVKKDPNYVGFIITGEDGKEYNGIRPSLIELDKRKGKKSKSKQSKACDVKDIEALKERIKTTSKEKQEKIISLYFDIDGLTPDITIDDLLTDNFNEVLLCNTILYNEINDILNG